MDKTETIRVLKVEPEKPPEAVTMPYTLEALRDSVGGYLEALCLERDVYLLCNEEGKCIGLPDNRTVNGDTIAGTFLVVGENYGAFCSLDEDMMARYAARFALPLEEGMDAMRAMQ